MDSRVEDALKVLTPERVAVIQQVLRAGLGTYDDYPAELKRDYNARVEANVRNCHIVGEAQRMTIGRSDIRVVVDRGRVFFIICDQLKLSFKKLDRKLRSRNIPTQAAMEFVAPQLPLPMELPAALVNIIAGYTVDRIGIANEMFLTVPNGRQNLVEYRLGEVAEVAEIIKFPTRTEEATTPARSGRRARVRKGAERKLETNGPAE